MTDTSNGCVFVCSCCQLRKSECPCPCGGWGCDNRVTSLMEQVFYDNPIQMPPPAFLKLDD